MKRHHGLLTLTALATAFLLAGCWGSTKSTSLQLTGGSSVADTATAVGIDKCYTCHANRLDGSNPADNATTIFTQWGASKHGNADPASHANYANFAADPTCDGARCHDPNGDGHKLAALGRAEAPIVGCEACHGGGSEHFGVGPMAYPKPNATACAQCHSATSPPQAHLAYHPNGFGGKGNPGIYEAYAGSAHAQSSTLVLHGGTTVSARCSKCHTDEGARKFSLIDNVMSGSPIDCAVLNPALTEFSSIQCRTCHKSHGAGVSLLKGATANSAQYNTCIACHQDAPQLHTSHANLLTKKHAVGAVTVGLIVNTASANACTECHNPHSADITENLQWANAGHGDNNSIAFNEQDFKASGTCNRCHTSTGFQSYTDNQAAPAATLAAFTANGVTGTMYETVYCRACHQVNAATGYTVGRRTPQAARIPAYYDNGTVSTSSYKVVAIWPAIVSGKSVDKSSSALCINCHSSRKGGAQTAANLAGKDFTNYKFGLTSHHGPAGATLFQDNNFNATDNAFTGTGLYQFPGKDYAKKVYFQHDKIGTTGVTEGPVPADNTAGPCVGCHMSSPNVAGNNSTGKHSFLPFTYDNVGNISAITATACANCHAGTYAFTTASINAKKAEFVARLAEFDAALNAAGIYFSKDTSPNFFTAATLNPATDNLVNWTAITAAVTPTDNVTPTDIIPLTNVDLLGVAYNRYYLSQDTGAWAHNDIYANRIIYDCIRKLGGTPSFTRP
ncbi:MAG TPA: hypothetical protein VGP72_20325 [Planctomycetota bacterium]|jgi:hypothetical protein